MAVLTATPLVNAAVRSAQDLPALIASLPPGMAAQLGNKTLASSRSPWGTLIAGGVAWISTRYGFGWDETLCSIIAGGAVLAGGFVMRLLTKMPIAGVFSSPAVALPTQRTNP